MTSHNFRNRSTRPRRVAHRRGLALETLESRRLLSGAGPGAAGRFIAVLKPDLDPTAFVADLAVRLPDVAVSQVYTHALKGFAFRGNAARFADDPRIDSVEADIEMHADAMTLPTGVDRIEADQNTIAKIDGLDGPSERVGVNVAILDTGIAPNHPDLNVVGGYNATRGSAQRWSDGNGHGTHVAGTVGALDNGPNVNGIAVVGVAPGARLWAVKVLGDNGTGWLSDIIKGIDWVTGTRTDNNLTNDIAVANMSLGGQGRSVSYRQAIQASVARGVVYVVSSGNDFNDIYSDYGYNNGNDYLPASYPEVMTISAMVDTDGKPGGLGGSTSSGVDDSYASFSNYSNVPSTFDAAMIDSALPQSLKDLKRGLGLGIDLVLPGVDILSTFPGGGYAVGTGTSMAAPHATGLVALYIAQHGRATSAGGVYAIREALIKQGVPQNSSNGFAVQNDGAHPENLGWAGPVQAVTAIASATSSDSSVFVAASSSSGGSFAAAWAPGVTGEAGGVLVPPVPGELGLGVTLNDLARKRIIGGRRRR